MQHSKTFPVIEHYEQMKPNDEIEQTEINTILQCETWKWIGAIFQNLKKSEY